MAEDTRTVAVVGGGAAGLAALRELKLAGMQATLFEQGEEVGGVYAKAYEGAMLTTSDHVTSFGTYASTSLPDSAGRGHRARFLTAKEYAAYLRDFAEANQLLPHVRLNTRVLSVRVVFDECADLPRVPPASLDDARRTLDAVCASNARFAVTTATTTRDGTEHRREGIFDKVVIATGTNQVPKPLPDWTGRADFRGTVIHSAALHGMDWETAFGGKRVLLVGLGETASDVSLAVSRVASATAISSRSGPGVVVPRYFDGVPGDAMMCRAFYALPERSASSFWRFAFSTGARLTGSVYRSTAPPPADAVAIRVDDDEDREKSNEALRTAALLNATRGAVPNRQFGTKNLSFLEAAVHHGAALYPDVARLTATGAVFASGEEFACDVVIVSNGYVGGNFAFFDTDEGSVGGSSGGGDPVAKMWQTLATEDLRDELRDVRNLHLNMYPTAFNGSVAVLGFARAAFGAVPPIAEMQARLHAAVLSGSLEAALPSPEEMRAKVAKAKVAHVRRFGQAGLRIPALTDYLSTMEMLAAPLGVSPQPLLWSPRFFVQHHAVWRALLFGPICAQAYRLRGGTEAERAEAMAHFERAPLSPYLKGHAGVAFTASWWATLAARKLAGSPLVGV